MNADLIAALVAHHDQMAEVLTKRADGEADPQRALFLQQAANHTAFSGAIVDLARRAMRSDKRSRLTPKEQALAAVSDFQEAVGPTKLPALLMIGLPTEGEYIRTSNGLASSAPNRATFRNAVFDYLEDLSAADMRLPGQPFNLLRPGRKEGAS